MASNHPQQNADVQLTDDLSELLDTQRNEVVECELKLLVNSSLDLILRSVLTPEPHPTTPCSSARAQQISRPAAIGFRSIGFGQCGLVFEKPGSHYILKIAKPAYEAALWTDFAAHLSVRKAFEQQKEAPECRVPRIFSYVSKTNQQWWDGNLPFFPVVHDSFALPAMALITERILPLPKLARNALITKYCALSSRPAVADDPTNRDCLARVYLSRRRPIDAPPPPNFTLRNYNLHLDQMIELGLPIETYAAAMGEALAIIHWSARVDGYDIEFVLGSEGEEGAAYSRDVSSVLGLTPEQVAAMPAHTDIESMVNVIFKCRTTRMWILDFNFWNNFSEQACWEHPDTLIDHLVTAFFENDPYYPLPFMEVPPDQKLWDVFSSRYLDKGKEILEAPGKDRRLACLPQRFIDGCVLRELKNLTHKLGQGHRNYKQ